MFQILINLFLVLLSIFGLTIYFSYNNNKNDIKMQPQDAKFLKRKVKSGAIDVHPTEKALVLKYELEYQVLDENGKEVYKEKKMLEKIIALPTLNSKTDPSGLGKTVIEKCELIHPSKLAEIEQLIYYLIRRKPTGSKNDQNSRTSSALSMKSSTPDQKNEAASIINVDEYIELLYEDIPEKIKGSALILQLAREPDNLDTLSKNEAVLSALSRVLREDWKRSIVLSTNLIYTFFCFSTYVDFHPLILHYKIGSLCMDIIEFELSRYDEWKAELHETESPALEKLIKKSCPSSASMSEIPRSKIPEPVRPRSGNWADTISNKSLMSGSVYDDLTNSTDNIEEKKQLSDAEKAKRYRTLIKKQEQLLRVAFYLLLNISEDLAIEEKMVKKNITGLLIKSLERENVDLLVLVMTFLKKLSMFDINVDMMTELDVVEKVPKFLDSENADLVHLTLKLLFNISFEKKNRAKIIKVGYLPKFINLLTDDRHQCVIIKLLYILSVDDKVKAMISRTDCVSLIIDMILLYKDDSSDIEMIGLAINLAINLENTKQMIKSNSLHNLMARAFKFQNSLLMKLIRRISEHKSIAPNFLEFIGDLANAIVSSKDEDFIIECIGVLGNIWLPDLDYSEIFSHFKLIPWFTNVLKPKSVPDDLVLYAVTYLGTAAADKDCGQLICNSGLLQLLIELLKVHQEDDEIVYQIIYVFLRLLQHRETKNYVILETEAPGYFIDLIQDQNKVVSKTCDLCLDIISAHNQDWKRRIQIEKFRNHNTQWLQMIETHATDDIEFENEINKDELAPYMNAEFLATHSVPDVSDIKMKFDHNPFSPGDDLDILDRFDEEFDLELI